MEWTIIGDDSHAQHVSSDSHYWLADEPVSIGGQDSGPDPYEHLLAALGTCTVMTLRQYADRKGLPLRHIKIELSHDRIHSEDCASCENQAGFIDRIDRNIELKGSLDKGQRDKLLQIADKCPIHRTLHNQIAVKTTILSQKELK